MEYESLLDELKKRCGNTRPSLEQIEKAMDDVGLPSDYEIDLDDLILDLSCHQVDILKMQVEHASKRYNKLERLARKL